MASVRLSVRSCRAIRRRPAPRLKRMASSLIRTLARTSSRFGKSRSASKKEIDGKEYDICSQCWSALAEKLSGKGRVNKSREIVLLPPLRVNEREDYELKPTPGEPPKIWGVAERPN